AKANPYRITLVWSILRPMYLSCNCSSADPGVLIVITDHARPLPRKEARTVTGRGQA
ncbi:hypothetical protein AVEN_218875-1, partial [Araneus ventricosus]